MAAGKKLRQLRKTTSHRRRGRNAEIYARWLRTGTVAAGLGAAIVAGSPAAVADTPNEETVTTSRDEARTDPSGSASPRDSESPQTESDPSVEASDSNVPRPTESVDGAGKDEIPLNPDTGEFEEDTSAVTAEPEHATDAGLASELDEALEPQEAAEGDPPPATVTPGTLRDSADAWGESSTAGRTSLEASESSVIQTNSSTTIDDVSIPATSQGDRLAISAGSIGPDTAVPTRSAVEARVVAEPSQPRGVADEQITWRGIVSDVLTWIGLRPLADDSPIPATPAPPLVEALWSVVRQVQYTLNNRRPVAIPTVCDPDPVTGDINGSLNAVDYDGDQLTYVLTTPPAAGEVTIDAAGNFIYRPGAELAAKGGVDEFTVIIDDKVGNPPHLHGLFDLFGLVPPVSATVRIAVAAADDNGAPVVAVSIVGGPDPDTGAISYRIEATDPDAGDVPGVTITEGPEHGALTANPSGGFTYTPHRAYAHAVGGGGPDTDAFTVTADDGRGGVTGVVVPITVAFVNAAPSATTEIADPHPQNGAVAGVLTAADDDGDEVAYAVGTPPEKGSLNLDPTTGVWTYTPYPAARVAAAGVGAPAEATQDTFVLTVTDGYTLQEIPVEVTVLAPHNRVVATIPVGDWPLDTSVSPDGARVYVANSGNGTVSVIDTSANAVVATVAVGFGTRDVEVSPDGSRVYVVDSVAAALSVIDTVTNTVVGSIAVGGNPQRVAISPDGTRAYVADIATDAVVVVDIVTETVVTAVAVGGYPVGAAISPDGTRVYVINQHDDSVSVIDTTTNTVTDTVTLGRATTTPDEYPDAGPLAVAVSPDGARVYVANYSFYRDNSVSVIDTTTNTVIGSSPVGTYYSFGVAASSDGAHSYVTNYPDNFVAVVDTGTGAVMAVIAVGEWPAGLSVSPDSSHVYVPNSDDNTVSVISVLPVAGSYTNAAPTIVTVTDDLDLQTGVSTGTVTGSDADADPLDLILTSLPTKGAVLLDSSTGTWTYTPTLASRLRAGDPEATDEDKQDSFTIAASDGYAATPVVVTVNVSPLQITPLATITVGEFPMEVAFSPDGSRAYVSNFVGDTVSVIDTATDAVIATVPVALRPTGVSASPDGARVYVVSGVTNRISVIDTASNAVGATITTPTSLSDNIVFHPVASQGRAYAVGLDRVLVIDTVANTVLDTIMLGGFVTNLAISADGSLLYVTRMFDDFVSVIDTADNTLRGGFGVGHLPDDIVVGGDGTRIYVGSDTVDVIDAEELTRIGAVAIPDGPSGVPDKPGGVAVSPSGVAIFATNPFSDSVSVIDPATDTIVATVAVGDAPGRLAVSPDGTRVYVLNTVADTVTVIGLVPVQ